MRAPPAFAHHENGKNNDQREAQSDEGFVCLSRIRSSCKTKKENACEKQRPCNDFLPHDRSSGSIISQTEWKLVPEQSGILKIHCEGETETVNVLHDHFVAVVHAHGATLSVCGGRKISSHAIFFWRIFLVERMKKVRGVFLQPSRVSWIGGYGRC